jgi:subtilisin family serine protease
MNLRVGLLCMILATRAVFAESTSRISLWVELTGASTVDAELAARALPKASTAASQPALPGVAQLAAIRAEQGALEPQLAALGCTVIGRCTALANAIHVLAPEGAQGAIMALPGVARVRRANHFKRALVKSVPFVGAPRVWTAIPGATGAGVRIGILDSGIDYLHADFGGSGNTTIYANTDPTVIAPGTFPTKKVVDGYDFVGDDYDSGSSANNIPKPDPNPLDPAANGHGTHVAGIAAGFGVTAGGNTYTGPYTTNLAAANFLVGPGVAPGASLVAYKIFGASGSTDVVPEALDRAADPNQDGNSADHLDVVNLSLGASFGITDATDLEQVGILKLAALGTVVAVAAGNEGDTMYIVSAPGVAPAALTAANSIDNGQLAMGLVVSQPAAAAGTYVALEADFTPALASLGPITGKVVATSPYDACSTLVNAPSLKGNIALIIRHPCYFADKIRAAQAAGARAVIMVNDADGPPITMGAAGDTSDITIPAVMVAKADGAKIAAALAAGEVVSVRLDASIQVTETFLADQLDDSSSRGPALGDDHLKPDMSAPGYNITSAEAGGGTQGVTYSGTSMATPHLAGAAALLKQRHPDWPSDDIKAALMNTAVVTRDGSGNPYPASRTGAGRLRADLAAATPVIAKGADPGMGVSLSLGDHVLSEPQSFTRDVELVNHGDTDVTLAVTATNNYAEAGIAVAPVSPTVVAPAHGTAIVQVRFTIDPTRFTRPPDPTTPARDPGGVPNARIPESSGALWFTGGPVPLHLPWYGIFRAASVMKSTVSRLGTPRTSAAPIYFATRGGSGHSQPLASVFLLGATNINRGFTGDEAATDLVAVGAVSDFHTAGAIASTKVYFALAVAGAWATPQRALYDLDVEIDVNRDGVADYTILNSDTGAIGAGDSEAFDYSSAALESVVRTESSGNFAEEGALNLLSPDFRDTALFRNGVLIHGVNASDIGLTAGASSFRYRVVTAGAFNDQTDWIDFDAAKPVLDPTGYGLTSTPFFDEGLGIAAAYYPSEATARGYTAGSPPTALLLHQHNLPGSAYDLVALDPTTDDVDGDGLSDAWEMQYFGDLSQNGADDTNGDGVPNSVKFANGLDPVAPHLAAPPAPAGPLRWSTWPGYSYVVERADAVAGPFTPVSAVLPAASAIGAGAAQFQDPGAPQGPGAAFYRVRRQ